LTESRTKKIWNQKKMDFEAMLLKQLKKRLLIWLRYLKKMNDDTIINNRTKFWRQVIRGKSIKNRG
jgi:hypothetical protein